MTRQLDVVTVTPVTDDGTYGGTDEPGGRMARRELQARRLDAVRAWTAFVERGDEAATLVRPEILRSWELLRRRRSPPTSSRRRWPTRATTAAFWRGSPLQTAVERVEAELRRTAEDGDLVIAVTDAETRILWTYGGRVMRRKAETVNFVPAGRWDEGSVGTNALDIANRTDGPSMVFSAEHYASMVHNWVCWAAPLHDPVTGRQLGVIDLSTTWDRTHPIGLATARVMARLIETAMPRSHHAPAAAASTAPTSPGWCMSLLGTAEAWLDGQRLLLNRRQTEVLALLAMHPEGLSLEHLHALVYGDQSVTVSTLKAEVSHLRARPRRPARVAPLPAMLPVAHRRRRGARPAAPGRRARRGRRRTAATCCRAPTPRRWPSSPSTSRSAVREALLADPRARRGAALQRAGAVRRRGASRSAWPPSAAVTHPV